ncbi:hypothetical protein [Deinococcus altitudinis]|uniref:hypothetical protein n=1 Tax=Deinococcus altitudinis TaxID=468914 RepID=UPI003891F0EB
MSVPTRPESPALESLLAYFGPLSTLRRDFRGAVTLHTPGSPVLGANASYLLQGNSPDVLPLLKVWHQAHDAPPLIASVGELPGIRPEQTLRVGEYWPVSGPGIVVVEQLSRLHMARFAAVLAEAHGVPEWASPLATGLAASLERMPAAVLFLAYAGGEEIGALLWHQGGAHLWGSLDPAADAPLLNAAAELSADPLWTSLPDSSPLSMQGATEVCFTLLS